mmetsp:Transcript_19711/g.47596  ORF Transcript_19711/g.47596 Transcript_19711/m.47596 type:complete len:628 (+) Transcript_19711:92-1975(+)
MNFEGMISQSQAAAAIDIMEFHGGHQSSKTTPVMEPSPTTTTTTTTTARATSIKDSSAHAVFHNNSSIRGEKNSRSRSTATTTTTNNKPTAQAKPDNVLLFSPSPVSSRPKVVVGKGAHHATSGGGKIQINPCFVSPLLMTSATTPMNNHHNHSSASGCGGNGNGNGKGGMLNRSNFGTFFHHHRDDHSSISAITIDSQLLLSSFHNLDTTTGGNDSLTSHSHSHSHSLPASSNHTGSIYTASVDSSSPGPRPTASARSRDEESSDKDDGDDVYSHRPLKGSSNHTSSVSDSNSLAKMYRRATNQRRRSRSGGSRRCRRERIEIQEEDDDEQHQHQHQQRESTSCRYPRAPGASGTKSSSPPSSNSSSFDRFASNTSYRNDTIPSVTFRSISVRSLDVSEDDGTAMANDAHTVTTTASVSAGGGTGGTTTRPSKGESLDFSKHSMHSMASIGEHKILSDEGTNISYNSDDSDDESDVEEDDGNGKEECGGDGDDNDDEFGGDHGDFDDYIEELGDYNSPKSERREYAPLKSPHGTNRFRLDMAIASPIADLSSPMKVSPPSRSSSTGAVASSGAALMMAMSKSKKTSSYSGPSSSKKELLSSTSHPNGRVALPPRMPVRSLSDPSLT